MCHGDGKVAMRLHLAFRRAYSRYFQSSEHTFELAKQGQLVSQVTILDSRGQMDFWWHISFVQLGRLPRITAWQLQKVPNNTDNLLLETCLAANQGALIINMVDVAAFLCKDYDLGRAKISMRLHVLISSQRPVTSAQPSVVEVVPHSASEVAHIWPVQPLPSLPHVDTSGHPPPRSHSQSDADGDMGGSDVSESLNDSASSEASLDATDELALVNLDSASPSNEICAATSLEVAASEVVVQVSAEQVCLSSLRNQSQSSLTSSRGPPQKLLFFSAAVSLPCSFL